MNIERAIVIFVAVIILMFVVRACLAQEFLVQTWTRTGDDVSNNSAMHFVNINAAKGFYNARTFDSSNKGTIFYREAASVSVDIHGNTVTNIPTGWYTYQHSVDELDMSDLFRVQVEADGFNYKKVKESVSKSHENADPAQRIKWRKNDPTPPQKGQS